MDGEKRSPRPQYAVSKIEQTVLPSAGAEAPWKAAGLPDCPGSDRCSLAGCERSRAAWGRKRWPEGVWCSFEPSRWAPRAEGAHARDIALLWRLVRSDDPVS